MERTSVLIMPPSNQQDSINILSKMLGQESRNLNSKLNLIDSKNISFINTTSLFNSIFSEFYGEMYHHFVLVRKYIYSNKEFLKNTLNVLLKIVHPNIQIFYGLMLTQDQKEDMYNFHCVYEYFNGINLCDFDYLKPYINTKEEIFLKLLLADKIAQTLSFIYKSGSPHLMMNGKNIKINHNLIMDRHQHNKIIYCDNSYIYANIIKINEIGSYFKYNKTFNIFCLQNEDIYEISFHCPELLLYLDKVKTEAERKVEILEKFDSWSFGCILFELFTEKRPYSQIIDKNTLINTICSLNENSDFASFHEEDLETISSNRINSVSDEIKALICACTDDDPSERPDFSKIVEVLSGLLKKYKSNNFTLEELHEQKTQVDKEDREYYDFKRFEDIIKLTNYIKHSEDLSIKLAPLSKELEEIENEYIGRTKEIENAKLKQQFNKDGTSVKATVSYTGNNYFIKYLMFTEKKYRSYKSDGENEYSSPDAIYVYDIYRNETMICDLQNSPSEDMFNLLPDSSIYFSIVKKKFYISGGSTSYSENEDLEEEGRKKRTNAFGYFYAEANGESDQQVFNFENLSFLKPKFTSKKSADEDKYGKASPNLTIKHFNRLNTKVTTINPSQMDKRNILTFAYNEKSYKMNNLSSEEIQDSEVLQQKVCYYVPHHKHLIKRTNHSVIEVQNYLFYIGGDQSRKCEILDLRDNNFYLIEELNTMHVNPIVFLKGKKIVSLNFENIKKFYKNYTMEENLVNRSTNHRFSVKNPQDPFYAHNKQNPTGNFYYSKSMKRVSREKSLTSNDFKVIYQENRSAPKIQIQSINLNQTKNHMIFCEYYDTTELTSNPKWVIQAVKFNLASHFTFKNFVHYKYLIFGEEMIYIIGSNKLYNPYDNDFKLSGLCFNIDNFEFTPLDKRTLTKLDPLKTCLGMGSNIIFYNNCYYYFNCVNRKVEKLPFNSLFS